MGRFRRSYLVPLPDVATLAELNEIVAGACIADLRRTIRGRPHTVGEALGRIDLLRPCRPSASTLPSMRPEGRRQVARDRAAEPYSLPVRLAGLRVSARIGAREVVFHHDGREVARHERLHGRFGT